MTRISSATEVGVGERDLAWFERSFEKLYLRGGLDTYWAKIRDTLPAALQQCIPRHGGDTDGDDTGAATDQASPCPVAKAEEQACELGFQTGQQEASRSAYVVPSQNVAHESPVEVVDLTSPLVDKTAFSEVPFDDESLGCRQGKSAYNDFMPMYTQLCTMADGPGDRAKECRNIMLKHLKQARKEMFSLDAEQEDMHGMASHPKISNKKVARRRKKATSPNKRKKK